MTITGKAKSVEIIEQIKSAAPVAGITGTEKQIAYAEDIIKNALFNVVRANSAYKTLARDSDVSITVDEKIMKALSMHKDAATIINNKHQYDFASNQMIVDLITIN